MAETEATAAHAVDEDGKTAENKTAEPEQTTDKTPEQPEVSTEVNSKDTVNKDEVVADGAEAGAAAEATESEAASGAEGEQADTTEGTSAAEHKTSLLDSFLHKSGLGKVMGGRKKKEQSAAAGAEESTAEGGDKEGEKSGEKSGEEAEVAAEGEGAAEKEAESTEKEEDKKDKSKTADAKSTVRDFIRKPVARIFSHRSTDKKDGSEPQKKVRSKSLDRIEDAEALNTTDLSTEEGAAAGGAEDEGELKASSAQAKHMKRWHSFKKMMAQKTHKKSSGGGEDGKEEGAEGDGGGDSSTLDSKESGQKRWKLKRSWTFQGLKRDPSIVGISSKAKGSDKEATDGAKGEEETQEAGGEEAPAEGAEGPSAEGGEEEKSAAAGVGAVTQHANEIWTSFKKRVIPKSKRTNTECAPEEDTAAGEEGSSEEGKDGKSAKAKRSHFGRAVSLKNFILRKGKSTSVDMSEGAKEEEGAPDGEEVEASAEPAADGEAAPTAEGSNTPPTDNEAPAKSPADEVKTTSEEKAAEDTPVTNCENGCSNGTDDSAHNHQEDDTTASPVKKSKVAGDNAKIINTTAPCNSGESEPLHLDTSRGSSNHTHSLHHAAGDRGQGGSERGQDSPDEEMGRRKGEIREAAVAIVQNVMSAAADQLERELCTSNGHH